MNSNRLKHVPPVKLKENKLSGPYCTRMIGIITGIPTKNHKLHLINLAFLLIFIRNKTNFAKLIGKRQDFI